uniref:DUF1618 domain-containing protein n=1 Tax=Oryza barthii TaxID=65489 RepID=A0A0D3ELP5_9ORYZ
MEHSPHLFDGAAPKFRRDERMAAPPGEATWVILACVPSVSSSDSDFEAGDHLAFDWRDPPGVSLLTLRQSDSVPVSPAPRDFCPDRDDHPYVVAVDSAGGLLLRGARRSAHDFGPGATDAYEALCLMRNFVSHVSMDGSNIVPRVSAESIMKVLFGNLVSSPCFLCLTYPRTGEGGRRGLLFGVPGFRLQDAAGHVYHVARALPGGGRLPDQALRLLARRRHGTGDGLVREPRRDEEHALRQRVRGTARGGVSEGPALGGGGARWAHEVGRVREAGEVGGGDGLDAAAGA